MTDVCSASGYQLSRTRPGRSTSDPHVLRWSLDKSYDVQECVLELTTRRRLRVCKSGTPATCTLAQQGHEAEGEELMHRPYSRLGMERICGPVDGWNRVTSRAGSLWCDLADSSHGTRVPKASS
ncbi:hypothetical protein NDU88_001645 [Pleurodeles waltl]|uniref:Uncharacterized protein n=1 Tax=Pleurodeles waltl TaxID=8319 RepID=A0AAV7QAQ8_PLEWA|nr:hypothetical protein NDU88_001645 [Pleurodeles waltl]